MSDPNPQQLSFTDLAHLAAYEQEEAEREEKRQEEAQAEALLRQKARNRAEPEPKALDNLGNAAQRLRTIEQQQGAIDRLRLTSQDQRGVELLSIVLGLDKDSVARMVEEAGDIYKLAAMPVDELIVRFHLTPKRAERIRAMTDWALLLNEPDPGERVQIRSPADAANLFMLGMSLLDREQLKVLCLDTKNNLIAVKTVYSGSLNSAVVRIGEVLRKAIIMDAASIILVHNHPSGDPTPSPEDIRVTELIKEAAELHDIDVLDHMIFGRNRYVSLKERGLGFG